MIFLFDLFASFCSFPSLLELDEDIKGKTGSKTVVQREEFKELSQNAFKVTIGRVQQLTLERAAALKLPTPQEQLSMVQQRRDAKKSREKTASPSLFIVMIIGVLLSNVSVF